MIQEVNRNGNKEVKVEKISINHENGEMVEGGKASANGRGERSPSLEPLKILNGHSSMGEVCLCGCGEN